MTRWSDGLGRTIVIAAIAGSLFAGFLALAPRLTASEAETAPAGSDTALPLLATSSLPGISDPVVAVPAGPVDVQVTVTTDPPSATDTTLPDEPSTTTVPDPALDGTIEMSVEASDTDLDGVLIEGDEIQWRFSVTNTSNEELWGAYVYLELHGPAWCEQTNLEPGESTDCWITTQAVEGAHTAQAWSTAWTIDRLVKAKIEYAFEVTL
jgi:hypothetical protein